MGKKINTPVTTDDIAATLKIDRANVISALSYYQRKEFGYIKCLGKIDGSKTHQYEITQRGIDVLKLHNEQFKKLGEMKNNFVISSLGKEKGLTVDDISLF